MVIPSLEIKQLILDWYCQISSGEMVAAAKQILSEDPTFLALGTSITEWICGREELIRAYSEVAALGNPEIHIQQLEAYQEGSVGWAVDTVILRRPGKHEIPMRHTFVFHQENGEWKVIHAHYSFPFPVQGSSAG